MTAPAGRLLCATLVLLIALAIAGWWTLATAARGFSDELTQRLNGSIAMYVAAEAPLIRAGRVDEAQMARLAHQAMVINPIAEVYLLDPAGRIVAHGQSASPAVSVVALAPIHAFLARRGGQLIYGTDPRTGSGHRVFSAAQVRNGSTLEGYVYVVLGGAAEEGAAATISGSYILRAAAITLLIVLLLTAVAAAVLTAWLTRPLHHLHGRVLALDALYSNAEPRVTDKIRVSLDSVREAVESLAARLAAQVQRLEAADRMRRDMYASISHDLRTPLTAMRGYLDTLASSDTQLPASQRSAFIGVAARHCERLSRLVEQIFALARLDATHVKLRPERVALTELAQDVVTKLQVLAESGRVRLRLEVDPHTPPVLADIGMLEAVLQNLLDNALRHTPPGGRICVSVGLRGEAVETVVEDSGDGMRPADLERLQQANEVGAGGRTGLGLAIVKRVLELHGSALELTSAVGSGTTARFVLASAPADAAAANAARWTAREEVVTNASLVSAHPSTRGDER
jgi:two-component system OmpR family sensor kinase